MSKPILNLEPSPIDERDWIAESIFPPISDSFPSKLDLRDDMQPVRSQGNQGTCAAQTASAMKEWQEHQDVNLNEYLSPQFVYDNRCNPDSSGMYARDVMKILNKVGICKETTYPYGKSMNITDEISKEALKFLIKSYAQINTIDGLKTALVKSGPCFIAVPVYNYGPRMWKPEQGEKHLGGHAMTIVGWTKEGFIIRNSWGKYWGDDGYTIFPYCDWGLQWEVWTTIDANSEKPLPEPRWYIKLWNAIKKLFGF